MRERVWVWLQLTQLVCKQSYRGVEDVSFDILRSFDRACCDLLVDRDDE